MKKRIPQERYLPSQLWGGRKERDGFVCSSNTKKKGSPFWCVAVKRDGDKIHIRDTKDETDSTLSFSKDEWSAFVAGIKKGEFDV